MAVCIASFDSVYLLFQASFDYIGDIALLVSLGQIFCDPVWCARFALVFEVFTAITNFDEEDNT